MSSTGFFRNASDLWAHLGYDILCHPKVRICVGNSHAERVPWLREIYQASIFARRPWDVSGCCSGPTRGGCAFETYSSSVRVTLAFVFLCGALKCLQCLSLVCRAIVCWCLCFVVSCSVASFALFEFVFAVFCCCAASSLFCAVLLLPIVRVF